MEKFIEIVMMEESYRHLRRSDCASSEGWNGRLEGRDVQSNVSFLFHEVDCAGKGPPLHKHPYDEICIVRQGKANVVVGESELEVSEGDILIVPAETPHKVSTAGKGVTEIISVHASDRFRAEMLDK